ncbi:MAG: hypothetical protein CMK59_04815 [Proteobacteria bacterium]|nr:hypothetical protein [Pseudomonadota bacterium]
MFLGTVNILGLFLATNIAQAADFSFEELQKIAPTMMPLLDVIAEGEGEYYSINRGRAGDSPGDWPKEHLGKSITQMTLLELRGHQGGKNEDCWLNGKRGKAGLYAVGRYQLIPCTFQWALSRIEGIDMQLLYNEQNQDALATYLVLVKRPVLGAYLLGWSRSFKEAGQELAKEFASVPIQYRNKRCKRGQSYYCNDSAGNAAQISLNKIKHVLPKTRRALMQNKEIQKLIAQKEDWRLRCRRILRRFLQRFRVIKQ